MSDVSVIVVSYFTGPVLGDCLDRLAGDASVREVVIVDNGNPPDVSIALAARAARDARFRLVAGHGNVGFSRGCNLGAAAASGGVLAFINPDVRIEPGCIAAMAETARAGAQPCIAGARILWADGREQRGGRRDVITPWNALVAAAGLGGLERYSRLFRDPHRERDPVPAAPLAVGAVSGAAMAMTAEAFRTLGGFDEGYFLHAEDLDICRRALEAGGAVLFTPQARALHAKSTSAASPFKVEAAKARSFFRYFLKFAHSPASKAAAAFSAGLVGAGLLLRGAARRLRARQQFTL